MKAETAIMLQTLHERIEINRKEMTKHIRESLSVDTKKLEKLGLNIISGTLKYYKYRMLDTNLIYIKNFKEYPEFYNKIDLMINDCIESISEILSKEEDVRNEVNLKTSYKRSIQEYEVISHTINEVLEEFALNQEVKFPSISIYFKSKREDKGNNNENNQGKIQRS